MQTTPASCSRRCQPGRASHCGWVQRQTWSGGHRVPLGLLLDTPLVLGLLIREEHESLSLRWALGVWVIQQILHKA